MSQQWNIDEQGVTQEKDTNAAYTQKLPGYYRQHFLTLTFLTVLTFFGIFISPFIVFYFFIHL
jgi:hypothetical protein